MKQFLIFIFLVFTFYSCSNSNNKYESVNDSKYEITNDDINDSIEYVPNGKYTIYDVINQNLKNEINEYYEESVKCALEKELKRRNIRNE